MSDGPNKPDFGAVAKDLLIELGKGADVNAVESHLEEMYERGHCDGRDSVESEEPEVVGRIFRTLDDMVANFLYYDRKEDEDLPMGAIDQAIIAGHLTWEDIVEHFQDKLLEGLKEEAGGDR